MRGGPRRQRLGAVALCTLLAIPAAPAALAATSASGVPAARGPTAPVASDDARAWLAAADRALATRNYRGVFVHEYRGQTETMRVVHRVGPHGLAERLESMDGSGREFIRRGDQLLCYLPDRRVVLVEKNPDTGPLLGGLPDAGTDLSGQYVIRQVARARVSGRSTRVIAVEPTDQLRYGYRVWIDEATAMPLKMQLRSPRGRVLEQIVFTDLALPAHIAASELAPGVDARHFRWIRQDDLVAGASGGPPVSWRAGALPPGFRMTADIRQMLPGGPAEHLVFSDGLATVSVFVQRRAGSAPIRADDAATLGSSSAYSVAIQGYRVTVVGQVPPQTVRRIALAIHTAGAAVAPGNDISGAPQSVLGDALAPPQLSVPLSLGVRLTQPTRH